MLRGIPLNAAWPAKNTSLFNARSVSARQGGLSGYPPRVMPGVTASSTFCMTSVSLIHLCPGESVRSTAADRNKRDAMACSAIGSHPCGESDPSREVGLRASRSEPVPFGRRLRLAGGLRSAANVFRQPCVILISGRRPVLAARTGTATCSREKSRGRRDRLRCPPA